MQNRGVLLGLADAVLVLHAAYILFVVAGLLLIFAGGWRGWRWVRHRLFRTAHLAAIAFVVAESWLGLTCPLTTLEYYLRQLAGSDGLPGDFIATWITRLFFFTAPSWVFAAAYTAFAGLVWLAWRYVPPDFRPPRR